MSIRSRTFGRFVPDSALGTALGTIRHNISFRTVRGPVPALTEAIPPATLELTNSRVDHNLSRGFGMGRKEALPFAEVVDRAGGVTPRREPGDPFGFLAMRHPHLFQAPLLAEHHQHAHREQHSEVSK